MKKLIWVLGLLLVFAGTAMAGTADGETPADETVCDDAGLSGAPWGLCNAYCEAMDCDSDFPKASVEACSKIAEKFFEKTSGEMLPCEQPSVSDDTDGDTVLDDVDNCVDVPNADQADIDNDEVGDECDCPCYTEISLYMQVSNMEDNNWNVDTCISDPTHDYAQIQTHFSSATWEARADPRGLCRASTSPDGVLHTGYIHTYTTPVQHQECMQIFKITCEELGF